MFTTLRYDFEQNHIQGDCLVVFRFVEKLRTIAHTYPQKKAGAVKYAIMEFFKNRFLLIREALFKILVMSCYKAEQFFHFL